MCFIYDKVAWNEIHLCYITVPPIQTIHGISRDTPPIQEWSVNKHSLLYAEFFQLFEIALFSLIQQEFQSNTQFPPLLILLWWSIM